MKQANNSIGEIRVWAFSVCLAVLTCLVACKPEAPLPALDDAQKVLQAQIWGEEQNITKRAEQNRQPMLIAVLPADLPSPELFPTTESIYALLKTKEQDHQFQNYQEVIPLAGTKKLNMIAVKGGAFTMGSPENEPFRKDDETQTHVQLSDFWISDIEIPWELYTVFMDNGRPRNKEGVLMEKAADDTLPDAVTQPTAPYTSMNLGMGHGYEQGLPAIAMSNYAASKFCEWLSAQTGHYYRLPSEAEWEYACRAGSTTAYCFGNQEEDLDAYAWFWNNSHDKYQRVASKKPNAWGIYDMHGNVAEWVLDFYDVYPKRELTNPVALTDKGKGHVVRGGSWNDDPNLLRSASRVRSTPAWNVRDPQNPKSLWYLTDGGMVGFRIVRPAKIPNVINVHKMWNCSKGKY